VELSPGAGRRVSAVARSAGTTKQSGSGASIILALAAVTIASQFFRASTSALAPELIRDLKLSPEALGLANAAFFLALVVTQIPIGMLFDRFGPRRVVSLLTVLAVVGALLHAAAWSETTFVLARLIIGLGCAGSFMAAVVLCARWYGGENFATMLGRVFALSSLGYLLAGTPWAALAAGIGWRGAFAVSAVAVAGTGWLFAAFVRDGPSEAPATKRESLREILAGLREVWRIAGLLPILALHFIAYASLITMFGVWAGPYLHDVFGLDAVARGNVLLAMGAAQMAGTLLYGPLDRWLGPWSGRRLGPRKGVVLGGALLSIAALAALAAAPHPTAVTAIAALVLFSFVDSYSVVNVADANSRFPAYLAGRGATAVNLIQVIGTSVLPIVTGAVIGLFPVMAESRPEDAYRAAFAVIALSLAAGVILYGLFYASPSKR
jgi:predicted MFS family arabinose efflux permease